VETGHRATPFAGSRERRLSEIVAEVVGVAKADLDDNFWELGGNSLLAMQVIGRVRTLLGCELSVRALFEAETIGDMAVQLTAVDG
jgi:acyl carrier protein